ncbi:MAG TPA: cell division protein FtsL [Usitatibacter sp.]|nr:cell division protein FtsL [Usitatibacter sp.]
MARINALLLAAAIACALGVITAQHRERKLFAELDAEQAAAKKLGEEWTQLQLEQGTWATHKRVEAVASHQLGMRFADPGTTVIVDRAGVPAAVPARAQ